MYWPLSETERVCGRGGHASHKSDPHSHLLFGYSRNESIELGRPGLLTVGRCVRDFLFRAVRELLLNAVKHAAGKPVHIAMDSLSGRQVRITVSDKGPGLNADVLDVKAIGTKGFGLFNIRERILSYGGNFQIESLPGTGTRIILVAPCDFESS